MFEYAVGSPGTCATKMKNARLALIGWPRFWYFLGAVGNDIAVIGGYNGSPGAIELTPNHGEKYFNQVYQYDLSSTFD